jgi:hypothetical protein
MSALGHKRTFAVQKGMSALPPRADIRSALAHVDFGPKANIGADDLVCPTRGVVFELRLEMDVWPAE